MKKKKLLASSLALAMTIGATMNLSLVNAQRHGVGSPTIFLRSAVSYQSTIATTPP